MSLSDRYAPSTGLSRNAVIALSVVTLHVAALWALQSGLMRKAAEIIIPAEVLSEFLTPQPPAPPAPPTPPAPPPPKPAQEDAAATTERPAEVDLSWLWTTLRVAGVVLAVAAVLVGPFLLVILAKSLRRRSRRGADDPRERIAGGWDEYLDAAADALDLELVDEG